MAENLNNFFGQDIIKFLRANVEVGKWLTKLTEANFMHFFNFIIIILLLFFLAFEKPLQRQTDIATRKKKKIAEGNHFNSYCSVCL